MYELLLCGLNEQLAMEAEYFWNRKWKVCNIPDPTKYGWEHDLERHRICQALAIILVDSFNNRVNMKDVNRCMNKVPKWAESLFDNIDGLEELHQHYPGLGKLYFYLPWRHFSFIHPPCSRQIISDNSTHFWNIFKYHQSTMSLPLFTSKDTRLSSLCRLYELSVLTTCVPEVRDAYEKEMDYFFKNPKWRGVEMKNLTDPRERWQKMDIREPEVFPELVELVKSLTEIEKLMYHGSGTLPRWMTKVVSDKAELKL